VLHRRCLADGTPAQDRQRGLVRGAPVTTDGPFRGGGRPEGVAPSAILGPGRRRKEPRNSSRDRRGADREVRTAGRVCAGSWTRRRVLLWSEPAPGHQRAVGAKWDSACPAGALGGRRSAGTGSSTRGGTRPGRAFVGHARRQQVAEAGPKGIPGEPGSVAADVAERSGGGASSTSGRSERAAPRKREEDGCPSRTRPATGAPTAADEHSSRPLPLLSPGLLRAVEARAHPPRPSGGLTTAERSRAASCPGEGDREMAQRIGSRGSQEHSKGRRGNSVACRQRGRGAPPGCASCEGALLLFNAGLTTISSARRSRGAEAVTSHVACCTGCGRLFSEGECTGLTSRSVLLKPTAAPRPAPARAGNERHASAARQQAAEGLRRAVERQRR